MSQKDFRFGYNTALNNALRIVLDGGPEALVKEVDLRKAQRYEGSLTQKEHDYEVTRIHKSDTAAIYMIFIAALHDEFGFGASRIKRVLKRAMAAVDYIANSWADLLDYEQAIREQTDPEIVDLIYHGSTPRRPVPLPGDDIYTDEDKKLVVEPAWSHVLQQLGFTEQQNPDYKDCRDIFDQTGELFMQYTDQYEKIHAYDILEGVLWGKNHDWTEKQEKADPPKPAGKKRRKKR